MTTAILQAFNDRLKEFVYSPVVPVSYPGIPLDPPDKGMWLEALFFPNENKNYGWDANACTYYSGFYQISVRFRKKGQIDASILADAIIELFPKGSFMGGVKVSKRPWQSPAVTEGASLFIPVTIPYAGLIK